MAKGRKIAARRKRRLDAHIPATAEHKTNSASFKKPGSNTKPYPKGR
jgi:hypothetical protein